MFYFYFYDEDDDEIACIMLTMTEIESEFNVDLPPSDKELEEIGYELCEIIDDAVDFKFKWIEE
jgi:hypothetical protein